MDREVKLHLVAAMASVPEPPGRGEGRRYVVDLVQRWIFEGLLRDGEVISQEDLAEVVGLSRMPVRDGLLALESSGWVAIDAGVGARVVGLDSAAVRDNFELIGDIWALLLRRIVELAEDPGALVAAGGEVRRADTPTAMLDAAWRFRSALCSLARSPRIEAVFHHVGRIVADDFFTVVPDAMAVQRHHAPRIATAVMKRDADNAGELARRLHRIHARNVIRLLTDRGVLVTAADRTA